MRNNNDLPSWMQTPNDDEPENGDESADLPPWLRDDAVPEEPAAPPEPPPTGDLPPWLQDEFEASTPKPPSTLGGETIDDDYLASADALPDTVDSDLTYDEWMAQQIEERRPKSIEEEVPDLLSDVPEAPQGGTPSPTGQLPDWFLGLEELDTSEAPEWFKAIGDTGALADEPSDEIPPWMQGMVEPEEEETPPREDNLGDFFRSLGSLPVEPEEELPELDWISGAPVGAADEGEADDDFFEQLNGETNLDEYLPTDDLFAELRAGLPGIDAEDMPSEPDDPGLDTVPSFDQFLRGSDPTVQDPKVDPDDELPPIELDEGFFAGLANERAGEPGDIEEPDLSWFLDSAPEPDDEDELTAPPVAEAPEMPEAVETPHAPDDQTLNWLNELQGIVSSATRGGEADAETFNTEPADDWDNPSPQDARGRGDEFVWAAGIDAGDEADETEAAPDWLNAFADMPVDPQPEAPNEPEDETLTFDVPTDESEAPRKPSLLTGRLRALIDDHDAEAEPEAELPAPEPEAPEVEDDLPLPSLTDMLRSIEESPQAPVDTGEPEPQLSVTDMLRQYDEAPADEAPPPTDELIPDEELQGGWLTDDLLADIDEDEAPVEQTPAPSASSDDSDFFTLLERDADANVLEPIDEYEAMFGESESEAVEDEEVAAEDAFAPEETPEAFADEEAPLEERADDYVYSWQVTPEEEPEPEADAESPETLDQPMLEAPVDEPTETGDDAFLEAIDWLAADDEQAEDSTATDVPEPADVIIEEPELPEFDAVDWQEIDDQPEAEQEEFEPSEPAEVVIEEPELPEFDAVDWQEVDDQPAVESEAESQAEAAGEDDDFFASFGMESQPATEISPDFDSVAEWLEAEALTGDADDVPAEPSPLPEAEVDDFFAAFGMESQPQAETPDSWDDEALDQPVSEQPDTIPTDNADDMPDFDTLPVNDAMEANEIEANPETPAFEDIEGYLASLQTEPPNLKPNTARLLDPTNVNLDDLLNEPLLDREPGIRDLPEDADIAPAQLDWLSETSVGEVSAAAMVRKLKDERSADDLSDRLRKLRERGEHSPATETSPDDADPLAKVLPGIAPALTPAPIQSGNPSLVQSLALTPEQSRKVDLLKAVLAIDSTPPPKPSAIDATYDTAYPSELDDISGLRDAEQADAAKAAKPAARRRARRRVVIPLERLLITAVVALAVVLPFFVDDLRLGSLPPQQFSVGSAQAAAFERVEALQPGDLVLVGVEYGSTGAAELDGMTDDLLRHILMRGARPLIISGNPIGLLRSTNLIASINADSAFLARVGAEQPLAANADYYVVRYLPGSVIGLRAFSQDTARLLLSDIQGQLTGVNVSSMQDFALIAVVAESADDLRAYAEQIAPLADAPMIAAVGYAAAPLVEPYLNARLSPAVPGFQGLLVGYRDAYTYNTLLASVDAVERADIPTPPPPTRRAPVEPEDDEPVIAPEATAESTPEATEPPVEQTFAVVVADTSVNMRSGPGTGNRVVTTVAPGTRVIVLGENAAGDWLNVRLDDGQEGWISAPLLRVEQAQLSDRKRFAKPPGQVLDPDMTPSPGATDTPRPTRTPAPTREPTTEATAEPEASATPLPGLAGASGTPPMYTLAYRDERWYAMTLGIIVSASVIALGAGINIIRSIFRRRRAR